MAKNVQTPSRSQTPLENNSPNPSVENFASLSGTGGSNGGQPQQVVVALTPPSRRPRGRPPGSKNKPKAPTIIRKQSEDTPTAVAIQLQAGIDVIGAIIDFAHRHHVGITITGVMGSVSDVTFSHHVLSSRGSVSRIHGSSFCIKSLTGSYIIGDQFPSFFSSSFSNPTTAYSFFAISLEGTPGEVLAGVIGGPVVAASVVLVNANIFKKPKFFNVSFINGKFFDEEGGDGDADDTKKDNNKDNAAGGIISNFGHHSGGVKIVSSGIPKNNNMMASSMGHHMNTGQVTFAHENVVQLKHFTHLSY